MDHKILSLAAILALAFQTASIAAPTSERDIATLEKECGSGQAQSCNEAYNRYSWGRGVEKDYTKAEKYNRLACEAGLGSACTLYAIKANRGDTGYPKIDQKKVAEYALKGCRGGDTVGCNVAKSVANSGYFSDGDRAFLLGQDAKAVAAKPAPKPAPKPVSTGNRFLDECNAGSAAACNNYAIMLGSKNPDQLKYYDRACQLGSQTACTNAKNKKDYQQAAAAQNAVNNANPAELKTACDNGNASACERYSYAMAKDKSWGIAADYAVKACQMGRDWGCSNQYAFKTNFRNHGDESEAAKQKSRDWQIANARSVGNYASTIAHFLKQDRDVATLSTLITSGGANGLGGLTFEEMEDLATNFPSTETLAYNIVQTEWRRRGGPQTVARREADQRAWEEQQRQASMYQPASKPSGSTSGGYSGSGSSASTYKPKQQVCTESWREGYGGGRVVTCK